MPCNTCYGNEKYANEEWKRCGDFHGHYCPGLAIGYRAAIYARDLLDIDFSHTSDIVCISENDACGVDAVQELLGCSVGKGNMLFHMSGKMAFSFYNKKNGKSARIVLKNSEFADSREAKQSVFLSLPPEEMFDVKETKIELPEHARIFDNYTCEKCGEVAGAKWIRIEEGKKVCKDCVDNYSRFNV